MRPLSPDLARAERDRQEDEARPPSKQQVAGQNDFHTRINGDRLACGIGGGGMDYVSYCCRDQAVWRSRAVGNPLVVRPSQSSTGAEVFQSGTLPGACSQVHSVPRSINVVCLALGDVLKRPVALQEREGSDVPVILNPFRHNVPANYRNLDDFPGLGGEEEEE